MTKEPNTLRKAKIVATIGPSSSDIETIKTLILSGLNVARLNMSHGTHENHKKVIDNIRKASIDVGQEVAILLDLQGPKIRVDALKNELKLEKGSEWVIGTSADIGNYPEYKDCYIPTVYENLVDDCVDGTRILFDDGKIRTEAIKKDRTVYKIRVLEGGILTSNKGINLPDVDVSAPSFTEKDEEDLNFGLENEIDYIALSFVRNKADIEQVKDLLKARDFDIPIVSKIEKPQAVLNIQEILDVTDVIMVARGDMGVEIGNHLVPVIQKKLISLCNMRGIPVITATQMLESMIESTTPTRAEASDVANAIWDGTDAVMLSGETASGKYPVEVVKMMSSIICEAEKYPKERPSLKSLMINDTSSTMMVAASLIAENLKVSRIITMTTSGNSCRKIARFRPSTPVLGVTNSMSVVRRICLYWGIYPFFLTDFDEDNLELQKSVVQMVQEDLHLKKGDKIVVTKGEGKFFLGGTANSVTVEEF